MAHVFPKHKIAEKQPIDPEEINENFRSTVDTVQGRLNEHNVEADAFDSFARSPYSIGEDSELTTDFAMAISYESYETDHGIPTTSGSGGPVMVGAYDIPQGYRWGLIGDPTGGGGDYMRKTLLTKSSVCWFTASFQFWVYRSGTTTMSAGNPGFQFALAVDGSIVDSTVVGSLERANDARGEGIANYANGITLDAIIPLTAGQHKFEVYARMCADIEFNLRIGGASTLKTSDSIIGYVGAREMIILEMR